MLVVNGYFPEQTRGFRVHTQTQTVNSEGPAYVFGQDIYSLTYLGLLLRLSQREVHP